MSNRERALKRIQKGGGFHRDGIPETKRWNCGNGIVVQS